ncbi:regulatory protein RecX [Hyalangium rubrum]|uniref:Regulatory protein RecX n=1 Tax=Hyalangium rubrum TaxID=3103134 RepID=A0ABU5H7Y7_9BACT|nr:regulatory protein RecX [Hyalangium sp. s54d21]MDY7228882.1 regulatory protein RecX [Hyalangium sp. s54d21]
MTTEAEGPEAVKQATDMCLRLLAMRARSRHELTLALKRKGFSAEVQAQVLEKLQGYGYIDDASFARDRAASLLRRGRLGPEGVLQKLEAHGLKGEEARAALATASGAVAFEPLEAARKVLEQRRLWGRELAPKERARAGRLLHSRGFSEDVIHRLLGEPSLDPSERDD